MKILRKIETEDIPKYIFIGFKGWPEPKNILNKKITIFGKDKNFEIWDLRRFTYKDFLIKIKEKIPPINDTINNNYYWKEKIDTDFVGMTEEEYKECLWGILLPNIDNDKENFYYEVLFLLNIFCPIYLKPYFYVSGMGIYNERKKIKNPCIHSPVNDEQKNICKIIKSNNFVKFYEIFIIEIKKYNEAYWTNSIQNRESVFNWNDEDFKIYFSFKYYKELEKYQNSKNPFLWQKECVDMSLILEILFTSGEQDKSNIGYKLRKRTGVLIGWKFPEIEKEIKDIYNNRSDFIHGSFYKQLKKDIKNNKSYKNIDFDNLYNKKEKIRFILIAYLYLNKVIEEKVEKDFEEYNNVTELLEDAILNIKLRNKIIKIIKPIINLIP